MPKASKFSPDEGLTIYDLKDNDAVHYGEQSKGYVGKNLFPPYSPNILSLAGITLTQNGDGTFTANGTATANAFFSLYHIDGEEGYKFKANNYRLSGCPVDGSGTKYSIKIQNFNNPSEQYDDFGGGVDVTCNGTDKYKVYIIIRNGYHADNLVFKPMLTLENVPDSDYAHYVPYLTPNTELTKKIANDLQVYAKKVSIPASGSITITGNNYRPYFIFGDRNVSFMVWSTGTNGNLQQITDESLSHANTPTATYPQAGNVTLTNVITNASMNLVIMSYEDFTIT